MYYYIIPIYRIDSYYEVLEISYIYISYRIYIEHTANQFPINSPFVVLRIILVSSKIPDNNL